jgi:hypothetical protein
MCLAMILPTHSKAGPSITDPDSAIFVDCENGEGNKSLDPSRNAFSLTADTSMIPEIMDAIISLQIVSGISASGARDLSQDEVVDTKDAVYALQYEVLSSWSDIQKELIIAETLEKEVLAPRDTTVVSSQDEHALAMAVVTANEVELQSMILFNSFYMASDTTPVHTLLNRYRAMTKSTYDFKNPLRSHCRVGERPGDSVCSG